MARSLLSLQTLFCAFCLVSPPVMVLASKGVVPVLLAMAAATLVAWSLDRRPIRRPPGPLVVPLALLLLWATVASLWTFEPGSALVLAARLAAVLAAGLWLLAAAATLTAAEKRRAILFLGVGFALSVAILAVEVMLGHPLGELLNRLGLGPTVEPFRFNRGSTYLAILVWPLTAAAWHWVGPKALLMPLALLLLFLPLESLSAVGSLAFALAVLVVALLHLRTTRWLLTTGSVLITLAAPLLTSGIDRSMIQETRYLTETARHRLHIWSFTGERIAEAPIFGWGFNASRAVPSGEAERFKEHKNIIPLHPHNAGLQVWLELGLVGALLLTGLLLAPLLGLARAGPIDQALGLAMFACAFFIANVSYGLWQNQWVAALLVSVLVFQLCRRSSDPETRIHAAPLSG